MSQNDDFFSSLHDEHIKSACLVLWRNSIGRLLMVLVDAHNYEDVWFKDE